MPSCEAPMQLIGYTSRVSVDLLNDKLSASARVYLKRDDTASIPVYIDTLAIQNDSPRPMNISEAIKLGVPFSHPDMIGAYLVVDGKLIHRDNIGDFTNEEWFNAYLPDAGCCFGFLTLQCVSREDWYAVQ